MTDGSYGMRAICTSQLTFLKAQVDEGIIADAATSVNINEGETTTLTQDDEVFYFSVPVRRRGRFNGGQE